MVRRMGFPPPLPPMVWSEGGGGGGARNVRGGLLGPSLHPNLDPESLQNPEPRPETSMLEYNMANYSIL